MVKKSLILLAAALFCMPAFSQEEAEQVFDPYPIYQPNLNIEWLPTTFRFRILSETAIQGLFYKVFPKDETLPVFYRQLRIPGRNLSNTYAFNGSGVIEFYRMGADGQTPPEPVFRFEIPKKREKSLFVLRNVETQDHGKPKIEHFEIDLSEKSFPAGSFMVLNFSNYPIAGTIDGQLYKPFPPVVPPTRKKHEVPITVYAYIEAQNRIINVTDSHIPITQKSRYWICFFPSPVKTRPMVSYKILSEVMVDDEAASRAAQEQYTRDLFGD